MADRFHCSLHEITRMDWYELKYWHRGAHALHADEERRIEDAGNK